MDGSWITCMYSSTPSTTCSLSINCTFFSPLSVLLTGSSVLGVLALQVHQSSHLIARFHDCTSGLVQLYWSTVLQSWTSVLNTCQNFRTWSVRNSCESCSPRERRKEAWYSTNESRDVCAALCPKVGRRSETCVTGWGGLGWRSS